MISTFEHGMAEEEHGIGGYRMRIPENGCICWKIVYPKDFIVQNTLSENG